MHVPSYRKVRGARTRDRTGRCYAPWECAEWDLAHIKAVLVSNSFCSPYESKQQRFEDIRVCSWGGYTKRMFHIAELSTATTETCPSNYEHAAQCMAIQVFLIFVRSAGNKAGRGCVVGHV